MCFYMCLCVCAFLRELYVCVRIVKHEARRWQTAITDTVSKTTAGMSSAGLCVCVFLCARLYLFLCIFLVCVCLCVSVCLCVRDGPPHSVTGWAVAAGPSPINLS